MFLNGSDLVSIELVLILDTFPCFAWRAKDEPVSLRLRRNQARRSQARRNLQKLN